MYDSILDNQRRIARKFAKRRFGSYLVRKAEGYATYLLAELDGRPFSLPVTIKGSKSSKEGIGMKSEPKL